MRPGETQAAKRRAARSDRVLLAVVSLIPAMRELLGEQLGDLVGRGGRTEEVALADVAPGVAQLVAPECLMRGLGLWYRFRHIGSTVGRGPRRWAHRG